MISTLDITNATTRRALSIAKEMIKKHHEVSLVLPAPYGNTRLRGLNERISEVSIFHSRFYARSLIPGKKVGWPEVFGRTVDMLQRTLKLQFDLVHAFKPSINATIGLFAHSLKRKPLLIDVDDWEGKGGYADSYPYFNGIMTDILERTMPKCCDAVTAASVVLAQRVHEFGIDEERIFYIPNGVDPERFHPGLDRDFFGNLHSKSSPTVVYAGAIQKSYDLDLLINAFSVVAKAYPTAKCLIGGEGPERVTLERLSKKLGLEHSVIFTGWIPENKYPSFLAMADIFVVPLRDSRIHRAACHGKIIEYMSMGRPVIAGRVGESANYIEHTQSGYLVEPGNIEQLGNAITELFQNKCLAQAIGQNARKRVLERYTWSIIASRFENVYKQLL